MLPMLRGVCLRVFAKLRKFLKDLKNTALQQLQELDLNRFAL